MAGKRNSFYIAPHGSGFNIWIANALIGRSQPRNLQRKVLIADFASKPLRNRNKVNCAKFFPQFCKVLRNYGFGSVFVHDIESVRCNATHDRSRNILINLLGEDRDEAKCELGDELLDRFSLVFNPYSLARIVASREATNELLSSHGVPVPKRNATDRKIFSLGNTGYPNSAMILDESEQLDSGRYNVEFIDTRIEIGNKSYFTSLRIMCVGSRVLKYVIRARDTGEQRPEARDANTPLDPGLIRHLYGVLVEANEEKLISLAKQAERAYGPGFYGHDVVVDRNTGDPFLCESELKFYPGTYMRRLHGLLDDDDRRFSTEKWKDYADRSAHEFVKYCNEFVRSDE